MESDENLAFIGPLLPVLGEELRGAKTDVCTVEDLLNVAEESIGAETFEGELYEPEVLFPTE